MCGYLVDVRARVRVHACVCVEDLEEESARYPAASRPRQVVITLEYVLSAALAFPKSVCRIVTVSKHSFTQTLTFFFAPLF